MPDLHIESVWDYPRPPRLQPSARRIRIVYETRTLADTVQSLRILETSHPPVYYLPPSALAASLLRRSSSRQTFCEFKGLATYWTLAIPAVNIEISDAAWSYEHPSTLYTSLKDHLAFYANRLADHNIKCFVDDELILPQPGDFYGGWITSNLRGPFKGAPGTRGW